MFQIDSGIRTLNQKSAPKPSGTRLGRKVWPIDSPSNTTSDGQQPCHKPQATKYTLHPVCTWA